VIAIIKVDFKTYPNFIYRVAERKVKSYF